MPATPITATIFTYQVGFGDCFLLRFDYDDGTARHVLIDFGSTALPKNNPGITLNAVAEDIAHKCGGQLDIVVATHRHMDHVSGFTTKDDGTGPGDVIRTLNPHRVIQPWTEAPNAPEKWEGPEGEDTGLAFAARVQRLGEMQKVAQAVVDRLNRKNGFDKDWPHAERLRFIGEDNVKNLSAVKNLMTMAGEGPANEHKYLYAFHGCDLALETVLPGVKVHVLGPPTLRQTQAIRKQVSEHKDEFWLRMSAMMALGSEAVGASESQVFPGAETLRGTQLPTEMRWVAGRINEAEAEQMLGIVTQLDKAMNNTSLILLFEAGGKKLLFPGDAQLENWMYALRPESELAPLLDDVDLYKVGHHGSLNATPKSMWKRLRKRGKAGTEGRLKSVMSTMAGKHGGKHGAPTEVPRGPLVDALKADSDLLNTQDFARGKLCEPLVIDLTA